VEIGNWWDKTAGGLPRPFWYVWAGTLVNRMGYFVEPFLALYLAHRKLDPATIGVVAACFGAGAFASQAVGGYLADRIGRRFTLVTGMLASAVGYLALGAAPNLPAIAAAAAWTGLAIDLYRPAVAAIVADLVPSADRSRAFALLYWAINLGAAAAGMIGGFVAQRAYWPLFVVDAATCLGFAVLISRGVPETKPERSADSGGGYGPALRDKLLLGLVGCALAGGVIYLQAYSTLPLVIRREGLGAQAYGVIIAVNAVAVIVLQPLTLRWLPHLPVVRVFAAAQLLQGIGFGLTAFAHTVPEFAGTVIIWTLGEIAFNAVGPALIAEIAPADLRGRYNGLLGVSWGGSALLAPLIGTRVLKEWGGSTVWAGCFVLALVAAVAVLALGPALGRRRATLAQATAPEPDTPLAAPVP
jgi:MFS family permease